MSSAPATAFMVLLALAGCTQEAASPQTATAGPASSWVAAGDDRLAVLLARTNCGPFLGDTSNLVPVLVQRLVDGSRDTLRWVRPELMQGGNETVLELERLIAANFDQVAYAARVVAALDILGSMSAPGGRPAALRCLSHSTDSVRIAALAVLRKHPQAADWDRLLSLRVGASDDLLLHLRAALLACDPVRAGHLALDEILEGRADERLCAPLAAATEANLLARMRVVLPIAPATVRTHLLAGLARNGDAQAVEDLRRQLTSASVVERQAAVTATVTAGLDELLLVAARDEDPAIRLIVVKQLAAFQQPGARERVRDALDDAADDVRLAALEALAAVGDPQALETAFAMVDLNPVARTTALRAIRPVLVTDPAVRARFLELLRSRRPAEESVSAREVDRALALIPDGRAAAFLMDKAHSVSAVIQGVPAHRWYVELVGGMGPAGLTVLLHSVAVEQDPERRLNLIWAMSFGRDEAARQALLQIVDGATSHPYDILLAADLLVRLGPAMEHAPLLKRVALKLPPSDARAALNCLLWDSYAMTRSSR